MTLRFGPLPGLLARLPARLPGRALAGAALLAALAPALLPAARAFAPEGPAGAEAAAAAGPVSTAATGARCIGPAFDDTAAFQAAIDTGHTVYAPALGGQCHITRPLVMKTPGQIFHGDGRARTKIAIQPGFAGAGVFVAKTGEPGPVWRDFSVQFLQPDTDDRAKLTRYPPAFSVPDTPRFEMEHLGCYVATTCVDMKGNSGGATIADLQMSAFEVGIDIDGSLDTVRITDPHWWPFSLTPQLQTIFYKQDRPATAISAGRVDGLSLCDGLFLGGRAIHIYRGKDGAGFGTIVGTSFDSFAGIDIEDGTLNLSADLFSAAVPGSYAIRMSGGLVAVGSSHFALGGSTASALIQVISGNLAISNSLFDANGIDATIISQRSGLLRLSANNFVQKPNQSYDKPIIKLDGGRVVAEGNTMSDKGSGAGIFIEMKHDDPFNRVIGNASPGWPVYVPKTMHGTYMFN